MKKFIKKILRFIALILSTKKNEKKVNPERGISITPVQPSKNKVKKLKESAGFKYPLFIPFHRWHGYYKGLSRQQRRNFGKWDGGIK